MTIKELEERTGLPRANIRYYESEGLLDPARLPNGYRDYSEADAAALEKIKLLRQLHMDLDTIRAVQQGRLPLERALFTQLTRLEGDRDAAGRAAQVCRELEASGVEYGGLEPRPWLARLETAGAYPRVASPAKPVPPKPWWDGLDRGANHPWMRFLARGVDVGLYELVICLASFLLFRSQALVRMGSFLNWLFTTAVLGLSLLLEPFWLHYVGWTPGKWLFGLKVRDEDGEKLTLEQAFVRSGRVFSSGCGCNIPIYNLIRYRACYKHCTKGEDCPWDEDEGHVYLREERRWCGLGWAAFQGARVGALALGLIFTYVPLHTGALTTAEFCENFNHVLYVYFDSDDRLDAAGNWVERSADDYGYTIDLSGVGLDERSVRIEERDGAVCAVTITERRRGPYIYQSSVIEQAALIALEGAEKGGWPLDHRELAEQFAACWEDFETEAFGVRAALTVEHSGYEGLGQILAAIDGEAQRYEKTMTITLTGEKRHDAEH